MVVVLVAAEAVTHLGGPVGERVDHAALAQEPEGPVDRRQPDRLAAPTEPGVDPLGGGVVALAREDLEDPQPLPRRTKAAPSEERAGFRAAGGRHRHYYTHMKARIILATALVTAAAACGASGCTADAGGERSQGGREVVASFYPLAYAANAVAGPGVEVTNLTPPGAEPHDLDLSPADVQRVHDADLVLLLGRGFQPALEQAAERARRVVRLLEAPGLRALPNADPHVWLDPLRYALVIERIGRELRARDAADRLIARLRALDAEYRGALADCRRREIVTSHAAFGYLAARYGLEQIAVTGLSPEAEPSPRDLERAVSLVRATAATTVYLEPLVSPRTARTVARETNSSTRVLDPIEGLTEDQARRGEDYFSLMRANLVALREGLECR